LKRRHAFIGPVSQPEAGTMALKIAIAAGVLLVAIVGLDVAFNATASLQMDEDGEWRTLAILPRGPDDYRGVDTAIEVNRSETLAFRVVLDNRRPIGFDAAYRVSHAGTTLGSGQIAADAFGIAESTFGVPVDEMIGDRNPQGDNPPRPMATSLDFSMNKETVYTHLELEEVPR
jgi:hypothetical protein